MKPDREEGEEGEEDPAGAHEEEGVQGEEGEGEEEAAGWTRNQENANTAEMNGTSRKTTRNQKGSE